MKICYDRDCNGIGVVIATKWRSYLFTCSSISRHWELFFQNRSRELITAASTRACRVFALFKSLSRLLLPTNLVKCRRTQLKLNSYGPYLSSEKDIKFPRCLFTFSDPGAIKREIRHHVLVVQKPQRNVFEGQYLSSLSINYVTISNDLEKLPL